MAGKIQKCFDSYGDDWIRARIAWGWSPSDFAVALNCNITQASDYLRRHGFRRQPRCNYSKVSRKILPEYDAPYRVTQVSAAHFRAAVAEAHRKEGAVGTNSQFVEFKWWE